MDFSSHRSSWVDFDNRALLEDLSNSVPGSQSIGSLTSLDSFGHANEELRYSNPLTPSSAGSIEAHRTAQTFESMSRPVDDLNDWLSSLELSNYYQTFVANDITFDLLSHLKKEDLKLMIPKIGDRIRIWKAVKNLHYHEWGPQELAGSSSRYSNQSLPSRSVDLEVSADVKFVTDSQKSLHVSLKPSSAVRQLICQTIRLPGDSDFRIHDEFDYFETEQALKDAIFKGKVREFRITRESTGPPFAPVRNETSPTDDSTLTLGGRNLSLNSDERPTSSEVTQRISDYFPNSNQELLREGLRNSQLITSRFSTLAVDWRHSVRTSRRFSRLPISELHEPSGVSKFELEKSLNESNAEHSEQDSELLEQLDSEEMSPTKWFRGKLIGHGSFGSVYIAFIHFSGEIVAVKQVQLVEKDQRQKKMVDALRQEIRTLRDLEHDNIVQYRGFKNEGGYLNIFLEYVPGGSLAAKVANSGPLTERSVRDYVKQCLSGLAYLHERGIIHRDIKGANILVDTNNRVKISDFGLSKHEDAAKQRYSMQGTAFWMAPEVARAREQTTTKADIWSLGCLIIELVTGQHPFPQLQAFQALYKIGKGVSPEIPEDVSADLRDLILRCFNIDPKKRSSAQQLLKHPFFAVEEF